MAYTTIKPKGRFVSLLVNGESLGGIRSEGKIFACVNCHSLFAGGLINRESIFVWNGKRFNPIGRDVEFCVYDAR
jgi:hypothetical protein